jgi:uncharacterized protein
LLILIILAAACGKKMDPMPPEAVLPGPVKEFSLAQEGESLRLSWRFPTENLLGQPLTQLTGFRVERCEVRGVEPVQGCYIDFILVADIELAYPRLAVVRDDAVIYRDENLLPERRYYYRVAAYDQSRIPGAWSRVLSHAWGVLPRPPEDFKAEAGDRVVALAWRPVTHLADGSPIPDLAGYHVYRRARAEDWTRITPAVVDGTIFNDVAVENDVEYTYVVRAVRRLGPDLLESRDSAAGTATPIDLTPPPPVLNPVAAPTVRGVELRWEASPAPDLAGYRVYRRRGDEATYTLLTPALVPQPYYVDEAVSRGQTYFYYVTAVDDSPRANESLPSEETVTRF